MIARKTPFKSRKQARKELQDIQLKIEESHKTGELPLTERDWEILRWVCNRFGSEDIKHCFDFDFNELYSEIEQ